MLRTVCSPLGLFAALSACLVLSLSGCGSNTPGLGEVTGTVTLDGKPLEGAEVTFQPENGRPSIGTTDAKGNYTLSYLKNETGAKTGKHTVRISKVEDEVDANGEIINSKELIPAKYNTETELDANVEEGDNPPFNFDLKSGA